MSVKNKIKNAVKAFKETDSTDQRTLNQLLDFLGITDVKENALSESTYFACLKILSEAIGKLPFKIQKYTGQGVAIAREHEAYQTIANRPNKFMTATTFWSTMEINKNHYGNSYALIDGVGEKMQLWPLESDKVEVWYDNRRIISAVPDIIYIYNSAKGRIPFSGEEILHFRTSHTFDGIVGLSVQQQLKTTIVGNSKAQNMLNKLYDSGFTAKAVMQYTGNLEDKSVEEFTKGIERYAKGELKKQGIENIIPVPVGTNIQPLNMKLSDSQFLELKQYSALQIASAFGIKPYQIGDYTKSSYASAEMQNMSFLVDTLLYPIKQYEEELMYKILSDKDKKKGYHAKVNTSAILRVDLKTQIETLSTAVNSFLYTPNEARALLDKEEKAGGDVLIGNGTSIPITDVGKQYRKEGENK